MAVTGAKGSSGGRSSIRDRQDLGHLLVQGGVGRLWQVGSRPGPLADKAAQQRREQREGLCLHSAQALGEEGTHWREAGLPAESPPRGELLGPIMEWWRVSLGEKKEFKTRLFL